MKRSYLLHGSWALVTVITFTLGHQLARPGAHAQSDAEERMDGGQPERRLLSGSGGGNQSSLAPPAKSRDRGDQAVRTPVGGSVVGSGAEAQSPGTGPLTEDEIQSLARTSIKSGSPVDRRLAFDRLLQEMQSSTFTVEQALAMRKSMAEHGADGQQWKLFDYAWGASQPDAAVAYLDEIPEQYHDGFLKNMIPGLASENPQMAMDLFASLDPELQARVRPRFLEGLVDNDIALATGYLYQASDPENPDWRPMDTLAREIEKDRGLHSALAWAADLPEGSLRSNAWSAAYAFWAGQDPLAAIQSITEMPPSPDRDQALNGFVSAHAGADGERATVWAAEIASPALREAAMIRAGTHFFRQDESAAATWFASSGLPATALNRMNGGNGQ